MSEQSYGEANQEVPMPSGLWFNYRRVVGGTRLLLTRASPRLLLQSRVRRHVTSLVERVTSWQHVRQRPHQYGGTEFAVEGREIGHVHDWGLFDAPLPRALRDAVVESGAAAPHHILPDSGWASDVVETASDVDNCAAILRLSYLWHLARYDAGDDCRSRRDILAEVRDLPFDDPVADAFERALDA